MAASLLLLAILPAAALGVCDTNSGGSCTLFGCKPYRGKTECKDVGPDPFAHNQAFHAKHTKNCTCAEGYCSINENSENDVGECVLEEDAKPGKECPKYAWNQSSVGEAGCYSTLGSCDWGDCVNMYCECPKDTCADNKNAKCVPKGAFKLQDMSTVQDVVETKSFAFGLAITSVSLFSMGVVVLRLRKTN